MATAPGVNGTTSESATAQASDPPPPEGQTHAIEVDDEGTHPHSASPISTVEDDLLTGSGAIGVESDLAHLMVSSPRSQNGEGKEASPRWLQGDWEAPSAVASRPSAKKKRSCQTG